MDRAQLDEAAELAKRLDETTVLLERLERLERLHASVYPEGLYVYVTREYDDRVGGFEITRAELALYLAARKATLTRKLEDLGVNI